MFDRIFLWGIMGAGKSHQGKLLANRLKWQYIDLDEYIESKIGLSVSEIFQQKGEDHFRQMEGDALSDLIKLEKIVVSTGGGAPCFFGLDDEMLENGVCIYLEASSRFLASRLAQGISKRPLLKELGSDSDLVGYLENLLNQRKVHYEKAHVRIDCLGVSSEKIIQKIDQLF